jgi:hypothetical protein
LIARSAVTFKYKPKNSDSISATCLEANDELYLVPLNLYDLIKIIKTEL